MPFHVNLIDRIHNHSVAYEFGEMPEPMMTFENKYYPNGIGVIEYETMSNFKFRVEKTFIVSNVKYYQTLNVAIDSAAMSGLYLVGTLKPPAKPIKIDLLIGETDTVIKEIEVPFIPKTSEDYITIDKQVYQCKQIVFKKNRITIMTEEQPINYAEFESKFFDVKG